MMSTKVKILTIIFLAVNAIISLNLLAASTVTITIEGKGMLEVTIYEIGWEKKTCDESNSNRCVYTEVIVPET